MASQQVFERQLVEIAQKTPWFMRVLKAVRLAALPNWCIGAGAVRNLVWDVLHGYPEPSVLPDIDVVYFDPHSVSNEQDVIIQAYLSDACPDVPWEVTNQANIHHWYESYFGQCVAPFFSLEEAVASWPEFATAVGVRLEQDDSLTVIAPHGLDDLFSMTIRHNPLRASLASYHERVAGKRFTDRWPGVTVIMG